MSTRRVEFKDERNQRERKALGEIRCFLSKIKLQKKKKEEEEKEKSGITCLKLYALYVCKGSGERKNMKKQTRYSRNKVCKQL